MTRVASRPPASSAKRTITWLLALYTAAVVALAVSLHTGADATPWGMVLAFSPRWWIVWPALGFIVVAAWVGRIALGLALVAAVVAIVGVAQFELPARPPTARRGTIRVVTYNTDVRRAVAHRIRQDLAAWDADLVLLQDCASELADSLRSIAPSTSQVHGRYCFVSRWPVARVTDVLLLHAVQSPASAIRQGNRVLYTGPLRRRESGMAYLVRSPFGDLPVYSVHLPSPRAALSTIRWLQTTDPYRITNALQQSIDQRAEESAVLSRVVSRVDSAFIVAGDFNLPYGSAALQRDWGDLTNAFAHAGTGFGYTMQAGVFPVRIDHVLVPRTLEPIRARVLKGYPSEHQPVVVDLAWRPQ